MLDKIIPIGIFYFCAVLADGISRFLKINHTLCLFTSGCTLQLIFFILKKFGKVFEINHLFDFLSDIGIFLLLIEIGLELSKETLVKFKDNILNSLSGITINSIIITFLLMTKLDIGTSILLGIASSGSCTAIAIQEMTNRKEVTSNLGYLTLCTLVLQDIVSILLTVSNNSFIKLLINLILLLIYIYIGKKIIPILLERYLEDRSKYMTVFILVFMISIYITIKLGFNINLGAVVCGIIFSSTAIHNSVVDLIEDIKNLFLPIFFISLGFKFDLKFLIKNFLKVFLITSMYIVIKSLSYIISVNNKTKDNVLYGILLLAPSELSFLLINEIEIINNIGEYYSNMGNSIFFLSTFTSTLLLSIIPANIKDKAIRLNERNIVICGYSSWTEDLLDIFIKIGISNYIVVDDDFSNIKSLKNKGYKCIFGRPFNKKYINNINQVDHYFIYSINNISSLEKYITLKVTGIIVTNKEKIEDLCINLDISVIRISNETLIRNIIDSITWLKKVKVDHRKKYLN